ncbi:glycoside hydrolase [Enterobacteriaceae bacterium RIT693]|jgi:lipoprotein Spr|nr:glycoside hydrolase [Enterobacteriaceae bacterium RIT693]
MKFVQFLSLVVFCFLLSIASTNSFALNLPKEFASMGTQSLAKSLNGENNPHAVKSALAVEYQRWKGTRYRLGGSSRRGIDCSALVQHLFSHSFNTHLPRTTGEQIRHGKSISRQQLKAGDLVFFKTSPGLRHVGVYVGNNQFLHASTSIGVTITSLDNRYWASRYETARRLTLAG